MALKATFYMWLRKLAKPFLILVLLLIVAWLAQSMFLKREPTRRIDTRIEGRDITFMTFNSENEKSVEVKCRESSRREADKLFLKNIAAIVFKSGKMKQDVHFFSDWGIAQDDFNYFQIEKNARIVTADFTINAESFLMTGKKNLVSKLTTDISGKSISGTAKQGVEFLFELNEFKMFDMTGKIDSNGQRFDFQCQTFWIFKERNQIDLKSQSSIRGAGSLLSADEIILRFSEEFIALQSYDSIGNSRLYLENDAIGQKEIVDISAHAINSFFTADGSLERIMIFENGRLLVENHLQRCEISAGNMDCMLHPENQRISQIFIRTPGELKNRGAQDVDFSAGKMFIKYNEKGELKTVKAEGGVRFTYADFHGSSPRLKLDAENHRFDIMGNGAEIKSGSNLFISPAFLIDTRNEALSAQKSVKATILPGRGNVLFRSQPLFITAAELKVAEKGNRIVFKNKVRLFQNDVELLAGEVNFNNSKKLIVARGRVNLKFVNDSNRFVLTGDNVTFDSEKHRIQVNGNARLNQGGQVLEGREIHLVFNRNDRLENVSALGNVTFSKDNLYGQSQWLDWNLLKKSILFKDAAQITRNNAGTIKGRELVLNLDSNEIKVSGLDDRSETILKQD